MTRLRLVFACAALAVFAPLALANPAPPPDWKDTGSRRDGPFRACGSGVGLGLVGIGIAWSLMWVGHRFAGRVARRDDVPRG
jgi:hypothetical protein